eukprot:15105628-Ditylum_brightwellii.AAC.1
MPKMLSKSSPGRAHLICNHDTQADLEAHHVDVVSVVVEEQVVPVHAESERVACTTSQSSSPMWVRTACAVRRKPAPRVGYAE